MRDVMNEAFSGYAETLPRSTDRKTRVEIERSFKGGMLATAGLVASCRSQAEFNAILRAISDEAAEFMETIPCTCGECYKHEGRTRPGR